MLKMAVLILIFNFVFCTTHAYADNEKMDLFAKYAALLDGESGRVLYGKKDENTPVPMASTTKNYDLYYCFGICGFGFDL